MYQNKLPYNNRAHNGCEIKTNLNEDKKTFKKDKNTGHFKKKERTCQLSITKPKLWNERGYNEYNFYDYLDNATIKKLSNNTY